MALQYMAPHMAPNSSLDRRLLSPGLLLRQATCLIALLLVLSCIAPHPCAASRSLLPGRLLRSIALITPQATIQGAVGGSGVQNPGASPAPAATGTTRNSSVTTSVGSADVTSQQQYGWDSSVGVINGSRPLVISHRGASGQLPEHTLEAYRRAIQEVRRQPDTVI